MPGIRLTWKPKPAFGKMLNRLANKGPLYNDLQILMLEMVDETHRHAGIPKWKESLRVKNEGGRTGYKTGRLQRSWRRVAGKPRIENNVAYAVDFYYGHGSRTVQVPATYRRIRRKVKLSGQTRARKQTVAVTMVRAHTKRERPQVARPVLWTRRYIKRAEKAILRHVLK